MRYKIYFKGLLSTNIDVDDLQELIAYMKGSNLTGAKNLYITSSNKVFDINEIVLIEPEEGNENASSGVVKPPTLTELKQREKEEHEKLVSDPKALINRITQKEGAEEE